MIKQKLIYLYTSDRPANNAKRELIMTPTKNKFATEAPTDGMIKMWCELAGRDIIDKVEIFVDSHISCGYKQLTPKASLYVVPDIDIARDFISPGDIVIVRGGFKPWFPTLTKIYEARKNWILFYRANTNRNPWPFWDIILDDLLKKTSVMHLNRYWFKFSKPVNEEIFKYDPAIGKTYGKHYNVCIGASHIHAKKGQYMGVRALRAYTDYYEYKLSAVLPGGFIRCMYNKEIITARDDGIVDVIGHTTRQLLCELLNRSEVFIHAGPGGQNDRGVLEAMCCGLPVILASHNHFSDFVSSGHGYNAVVDAGKSTTPLNIARWIRSIRMNPSDPLDIKRFYQNYNGLNEVCIPKMISLFEWMNRFSGPVRPKMKNPREVVPWERG